MRRTVFALGFLGTIVAANWATTHYGLTPVGLGLYCTAGTWFAGLAFVLRDSVQDTWGKLGAVALIVLGAALSYVVAAPFIAFASGAAFLLSEAADLAVYTPLRSRGYVRAAIASNLVGAVVDTYVFLWLAGFPVTGPVVTGQLVAKGLVTAAVVVLVIGVRLVVPRQSVRA